MKFVIFLFCSLFLRREWSRLRIWGATSSPLVLVWPFRPIVEGIFSSTVDYNDAYALSLGWVFSVRENGNEMSTFVASEVEVKFSVQCTVSIHTVCGVNRAWEPGHSLYDKNPSYLQTTLSIERLGFHTTHHCTHIIFSFFQLYSPSGSFLTCLRLPLLGPVFWNIILGSTVCTRNFSV